MRWHGIPVVTHPDMSRGVVVAVGQRELVVASLLVGGRRDVYPKRPVPPKPKP